jgi:hypothetical protein
MDTNILVRAAGDEQGLAGKLLQEIVSGSHVLVSSPYIILGRRCKVRAADQMDQWWRTSDITRLRSRAAPWKWERRVAAHHSIGFYGSR